MIIKVKIIPRSKTNQIISFENDLLKIKIHEIPEKGKANVELINFLSEILNISKGNITIKTGSSAKIKLIQIDQISKDEFDKIIKNRIEKK